MTDKSQDEVERPEGELSEEEMAARLDEAIGKLSDEEDAPELDDDAIEILIEDDEEPVPTIGDAILSAVDRRSADQADLDTPDPAAEEELEAEERWDPVDDGGEPDMEIQETDQPKTHGEIWGDVEDADADDLALVDVEERTGDPWGALPADGAGPDLAVRPPPSLDLPPPVARLADQPPRRPTPPSRSLPWRGITSLVDPELPDLLFVADALVERSQLMVAAWSWDEGEPAGSRLRVRLADDGPELVWPSVAPHEAAIEARVLLDGESHRLRLALATDRHLRGLRLGRDLLAGRFQVDSGHDAWPEE